MRLLAAALACAALWPGATGRRKPSKKPKPNSAAVAAAAAASTTHRLPFAELTLMPFSPSPSDEAEHEPGTPKAPFLAELGLQSDFLTTAWDEEPRLVRLGPTAFQGLMDLSAGDLEALIRQNTLVMGTDAQFSQDGNKGSGSTKTLTVDEAHWRLDDGASFYSSINMYVTPPAARGFDVHFDYEDVIILQVHGSKRWRVWYIPRGYPHMAETTGGNSSVHFTMTVMSQEFAWEIFLLQIVQPGPAAVEVDAVMWSDYEKIPANLPKWWSLLTSSHAGCTMHDGSVFTVSSAFLLGLHRVAMERKEGLVYRKSFSPFWAGGEDTFAELCIAWERDLVSGLKMAEKEGILRCPKGTAHGLLLRPSLKALLKGVEWDVFKKFLQRRAVLAWEAATDGKPPPFEID